jgi:hypothetical protein
MPCNRFGTVAGRGVEKHMTSFWCLSNGTRNLARFGRNPAAKNLNVLKYVSVLVLGLHSKSHSNSRTATAQSVIDFESLRWHRPANGRRSD